MMKEWTRLLENLAIILWLSSVVRLFLMTAGNRKKNREIAEWVYIVGFAILRYINSNNNNIVTRFRKIHQVPIVVYVRMLFRL